MKSFLILFLIVLSTSCNSQDKSNDSKDHDLTNPFFSLPSHTVEKSSSAPQIAEYLVEIFEDGKGNLWFGTMSKGVARYNGKSLGYFTTEDGLGSNSVASIAEDKEGNMWFGTHSGLTRYDGENFVNFNTSDGLCHNRVSNILIDTEGNIWVGTWGGVCRFNGSSFSDFSLPNPDVELLSYQTTMNWVTEIMEDKQGNIWFTRDGYGACKYDGKSFRHFTKKDGLPSNNVTVIEEDSQGNIWFGTRVAEKDNPDEKGRSGDGGLSRYDGESLIQFPDIEGLSKNDIYAIFLDKAGNIWIGANGVGIYQYDEETFDLYKGTDRMDLTNRFGVQSILEDKNGILWFGFSGGLFRLQDASIVNVTRRGPWGVEPASPDVDPYFIETKTIKSTNGPQSITRNILQDSKGNIWLATWEGILRYDGKSFTNVTNKEGLRRFHAFSILEDKLGNLWFGTIGAGVYLYDGSTFTNFTKNEGLINDRIGCIYEDKSGKIWIGTEVGISLYNGSSFRNFTTKHGLSNNDINSIIEDKNGKIWIGTRGDACTYDGKTFTRFTNKEGSSFTNVRTIIEDKKGDMWFGGNDGLWSYDGELFTNYSRSFIGYIYEDKKGNIWISSAGASPSTWVLSRYDIGYMHHEKAYATEIRTEEGMFFGIQEDYDGGIWFGSLNGVCRYDGKSFNYFQD